MEILKINFSIYDHINILEEIIVDFKKEEYIYKRRDKIFPVYSLFGINYDLDMQKEVSLLKLFEKKDKLLEKEKIMNNIKKEKLIEKFIKNNISEDFSNYIFEIEYEDKGNIKTKIQKGFYNFSTEAKDILMTIVKYNKIYEKEEILNEKNKIYEKSLSKILINSINKEDINIKILKTAYEIYLSSKIEIEKLDNNRYILTLLTKNIKHDFEIKISGGEVYYLKFLNEKSREEDFLAYIFLLNEYEQNLEENIASVNLNKENKNAKSKNILSIIKSFIPFLKSNKKKVNKELLINIISSANLKGENNLNIKEIFKVLNTSVDFNINKDEKINILNFLSIYTISLENKNIVKNTFLKQDPYDLIHTRSIEEVVLKEKQSNKMNIKNNLPLNIESMFFRKFGVKLELKKGNLLKTINKTIDFNVYKIKEEIYKSSKVNKLIHHNTKLPNYNIIILDEDIENNKENKNQYKEVYIIGNIKIKKEDVLIGICNIENIKNVNLLKIYVNKIILNIYKYIEIENINLPDNFRNYVINIIKEVDLNYLEEYIKNLSENDINKLKNINILNENYESEILFNYLKENKSYNEYLWHKRYLEKFEKGNNKIKTKASKSFINNIFNFNSNIDVYKDLEKNIDKKNKYVYDEFNSKNKKLINEKDSSINIEEQIIISKYGR